MSTLKYPDPVDGTWKKVYLGPPDAPKDGAIYGRKDGAWSKVPAEYVPLDGSKPMTGNLSIERAGPTFFLKNTANVADKKLAYLAVFDPTGDVWLNAVNDANTVSMGGLRIQRSDGTLWDIKSGARIWHQGNDGAGSGLDADLLDGMDVASVLNTVGTIVARGGGGEINCAAVELGWTSGGQAWPLIDFHSNTTVVDYDARILVSPGGPGGNGGAPMNIESGQFQHTVRGGDWNVSGMNNLGLNCATLWQNGRACNSGLAVSWGWARILGGLVVQYINGSVTDDGYVGITLPIAYPANIGNAAITPNIGQGITGNSIISAHGVIASSSVVNVGVSCNFTWSGSVMIISTGY